MFVQLHNFIFEQIFKVQKYLFLFKWNISYIFILLDFVFLYEPTIKLIEYLFLKILILTLRSSPGPKWLLLLEGPLCAPAPSTTVWSTLFGRIPHLELLRSRSGGQSG